MTNVVLGADDYGNGDPDGLAPPVPGDTRQLTVEQRLWRAVLRLAMLEWARRRGRLSAESECWFLSARQDEGSFRWICEHLGLDPDYLWARRDQWRLSGHEGSRGRTGNMSTLEAA